MKQGEQAYNILMDAIQYRTEQLTKRLAEKYLPESLRDESEARLRAIRELHDNLFL